MNKPLTIVLALAAAASLSGCGNTLSGAKQDAAQDTAKTQQTVDQATQSTKAAAQQADQTMKTDAQKASQAAAVLPESAEANTVVRPAVKTAIIRDPVLSQPSNLIDVNAAPQKITLTGHVTNADMKQRATEDAQVALKKHPGYTLENDLAVAGAGQ